MTFQLKKQLWITSVIGLLCYLFIDSLYVWGIIFLLPVSLMFLFGRHYRLAIGCLLFFGLIYVQLFIPFFRLSIAILLIYGGLRFIRKKTSPYHERWFGQLNLFHQPMQIQNTSYFCGIGQIIIDLNQAILLDNENIMQVHGWFGQTTIYVPPDLPISITVSGLWGSVDFFGQKQTFSKPMQIASAHYDRSPRRLNISIDYVCGKIDVVQR